MSGAESTGERASRGTDGREKRPLTPRQRQVAGLAAQGKSAKEIAHDLGRSQRTVEEHLAKARERTGAASTAELVALVVLDQAVDGASKPKRRGQANGHDC